MAINLSTDDNLQLEFAEFLKAKKELTTKTLQSLDKEISISIGDLQNLLTRKFHTRAELSNLKNDDIDESEQKAKKCDALDSSFENSVDNISRLALFLELHWSSPLHLIELRNYRQGDHRLNFLKNMSVTSLCPEIAKKSKSSQELKMHRIGVQFTINKSKIKTAEDKYLSSVNDAKLAYLASGNDAIKLK